MEITHPFILVECGILFCFLWFFFINLYIYGRLYTYLYRIHFNTITSSITDIWYAYLNLHTLFPLACGIIFIPEFDKSCKKKKKNKKFDVLWSRPRSQSHILLMLRTFTTIFPKNEFVCARLIGTHVLGPMLCYFDNG